MTYNVVKTRKLRKIASAMCGLRMRQAILLPPLCHHGTRPKNPCVVLLPLSFAFEGVVSCIRTVFKGLI